jgi:hypothetical protein
MKNRIVKLIASVIAVLGGILFVVLGCVGISQVKNFPEIEATVTQVEIDTTTDSDGTTSETETVYVSYTVDGTEYNEILDDSSSNMKEGDKITVRYNPEKPNKVTATTKTAGFVRIAFGIVITLAGIASLALLIIRGR